MRFSRPRPLWIGTAAAFAVLAVLAAVRTADWSYGADTGTFVQIVLDAFRGMRDGIERGTHYRFHWSPSLALLWPFLAATHSVWLLQAILAAATVACAPLVAAIGRARGLAPAIADRVGAVVLVYPPLVAVGFGEFRDLGLLTPLALGWWLALERRSWPWVGGNGARLWRVCARTSASSSRSPAPSSRARRSAAATGPARSPAARPRGSRSSPTQSTR